MECSFVLLDEGLNCFNQWKDCIYEEIYFKFSDHVAGGYHDGMDRP